MFSTKKCPYIIRFIWVDLLLYLALIYIYIMQLELRRGYSIKQ